MPRKLLSFDGGAALPAFRLNALLQDLKAVCPQIIAVHAKHVHWAQVQGPWADAETDRLAALLRYGEPAHGTQKTSDSDSAQAAFFVVTPRLGTVSPWASKATDIARNCGLAVQRIERVTQYRLAFDSAQSQFTQDQWRACAARLHDRMTESVWPEPEDAQRMFEQVAGKPLALIDVQTEGAAALNQANLDLRLFKTSNATPAMSS
jgi:phosphoribosylformylglycinamidine synthase